MMSAMELDHGTAALILEAAEEQFALSGFTKVTMEEIASAAGLGKASLYYYYDAKDELFRAVLNKKFAEFEAAAQRIVAADGPADTRIVEYVSRRQQYFNQLRRLQIPDFRSVPKNQPLVREFFAQSAARELAWLTQLISEGEQTGIFHTESPERTALVFLHIMQGLRLRFLRWDQPAPSQEDTAELEREMQDATHIFLAGISAERGNRNGSRSVHKQRR